jgi:hypothetical protein
MESTWLIGRFECWECLIVWEGSCMMREALSGKETNISRKGEESCSWQPVNPGSNSVLFPTHRASFFDAPVHEGNVPHSGTSPEFVPRHLRSFLPRKGKRGHGYLRRGWKGKKIRRHAERWCSGKRNHVKMHTSSALLMQTLCGCL